MNTKKEIINHINQLIPPCDCSSDYAFIFIKNTDRHYSHITFDTQEIESLLELHELMVDGK